MHVVIVLPDTSYMLLFWDPFTTLTVSIFDVQSSLDGVGAIQASRPILFFQVLSHGGTVPTTEVLSSLVSCCFFHTLLLQSGYDSDELTQETHN